MSKVHAEASEIIEARPEEIYAVVSDYRVGHPAILPRPYFGELIIEKGGQGAGTVIRFDMKVYGQTFHYREEISEPEPGRVLLERDPDKDLDTKWTFEPLEGGQKTRLTISTDFPASPGLKGFIEKLTNPSVMRKIYKKEMRQLARYLKDRKTNSSVGA